MTYKEDKVWCWETISKTIWDSLSYSTNKEYPNKMPPRKDNRSGLHRRFEPISTVEVNVHPSVLFKFHEVGCMDFCQRVQEVKSYLPLTHLCALTLQGKHFQLAGLDFKFYPRSISRAIKIPYVIEKWFKQSHLDSE